MTKYHLSKKARTFAAIAFVLGVTTLASTTSYAANTPTSDDREKALVSALVQKFNLNEADVQTVIHSVMSKQKATMDARREQEFTARINKAVADGKLTQDQANLLIAKAAEVKKFVDGLAGKTPAEHKAAMKAEMDNIKQWLIVNNIPKDYSLFIGIGEKGFGHGPKGGKK